MKRVLLKFFALSVIMLSVVALVNVVKVKANQMIQHTDADYQVLPDKYNTGAKGTYFEKVYGQGEYNGIMFYVSGNTDLALSFKRNTGLSGVIEFDSYDFTNYRVRTYDESYQSEVVTLVFRNCIFSKFLGPQSGEINVNFEFYNCTFNYCAVSNAVFYNCYFGKDVCDGLVPFNNVYVNDCYFSDKCRQSSFEKDGTHTDGTQIYGSATGGCSNIHYENCRFEIPNLKNNVNNVNACIMLQIEYADATDITFNNCYANGGGYTIYARACKDGSIVNSSITNVRVGSLHMWGRGRDIFICPNPDPNIVLDNIIPADRLYVGSVWNDERATHISATNDTNKERIMLVKTNYGEDIIVIPACPTYDELTLTTSFDDLPFDMDVEIPLAEWVVCYDMTEGIDYQIRYVQFNEGDAFADNTDYEDYSFDNVMVDSRDILLEGMVGYDIVASGECGLNASWTLTEDGVFYVSGFGDMYDYHSKKIAPWYDYKDMITTVKIQEGITSVGSQAFKYHSNLTEVYLPQTIVKLGGSAFSACSSIKSIVIPDSVTTIEAYCFAKVNFDTVSWNGFAEVAKANGNLEIFR